MTMVPVNIMVPQEMAPYITDTDQRISFERNAMILYPLIQNLTISHGRAAELLGIHKLDLIEFYNQMGLPYLNQSPESLDAELEAYNKLKEQSA